MQDKLVKKVSELEKKNAGLVELLSTKDDETQRICLEKDELKRRTDMEVWISIFRGNNSSSETLITGCMVLPMAGVHMDSILFTNEQYISQFQCHCLVSVSSAPL